MASDTGSNPLDRITRDGPKIASETTHKMAEKEATVYILDVGASMGMKRNGRQETDLDWAMQYVWDKITSTVNPSI